VSLYGGDLSDVELAAQEIEGLREELRQERADRCAEIELTSQIRIERDALKQRCRDLEQALAPIMVVRAEHQRDESNGGRCWASCPACQLLKAKAAFDKLGGTLTTVPR
jgi:hypothetical protein